MRLQQRWSIRAGVAHWICILFAPILLSIRPAAAQNPVPLPHDPSLAA